MQTRPKITRLRLNDKADSEFNLFGLVSSEADYKVSQLLNKKLSIALKHNKSIEIENNGEKLNFSKYSFHPVTPETVSYELISNRSDKTFLLKKLNKIDFIFQIHDPDETLNLNDISSRLREIEKITAVFRLDPKEIKDKNLTYLTI
jgi:hypothetical protein